MSSKGLQRFVLLTSGGVVGARVLLLGILPCIDEALVDVLPKIPALLCRDAVVFEGALALCRSRYTIRQDRRMDG